MPRFSHLTQGSLGPAVYVASTRSIVGIRWRNAWGPIDRKALRETAGSITIIPVARGLPQALAAVRDWLPQPGSACETKEVRPRLTTAVP